jgi:hypothetical protein
MNRSGESPASAASPVSDSIVVKARRVMIKVGSRIGVVLPQGPYQGSRLGGLSLA